MIEVKKEQTVKQGVIDFVDVSLGVNKKGK